MTEDDNVAPKLDPVKKEVSAKLNKVQLLLLEVFSTNIDGNLLYDSSKVVANMVANPNNPPEYIAMVEHLLEKNEELMHYIVNRGIS
ncbi:MAG: hypothetical protein RMZ43_003005 [Nostoc sp. CmiVER01]|uniref:hypothetical protein n=1 Tax=Nostoc sp. CmiVER01 TaxID=3075384 RepID=UPI002AD50B9B|nr:hypothetical protein [Nostoc sp. CmiVER01]MDZ8124742.1 hypothetical protein [Nostoc sp. CmiVER01]